MDYNFDSIAGYAKEKAELMRLCDIFNDREKYEAKGAKMPKGIIFYGETGTGKTLFAKVMASVCKLKVFKISLGNVDSEVAICGMIKRTFEAAAKCGEQAMIFFDELDKVMPDYSEDYVTDVSKAVLAQLLTLIDGMDSTNNIVFVATCNYYSSLPSTLTRPGRIDRKIGIGLPGFSSRVAILEMYARRTSCTFEMGMDEIASLTGGFSCAALETLINECVLQSDDNGFVSREQLRKRFFEIENEDITRVRSQLDETVDSCRNVGALVVARSLDDSDYTLTMEAHRIGTGFFNGILCRYSENFDDAQDDDEIFDITEYYSHLDDDEDATPYDPYDDDDEEDDDEDEDENFYGRAGATVYSQDDLLNTITVCMGGPVAEEVILHKTYDNVRHLYDVADDILIAMAKNGMLGLSCLGIWSVREYVGYSDARKDAMCQAFDKVLEKCYLRAKDIIVKNETLVRELMCELVDQQALSKEQCEDIIAKHGVIC